MNKIYFANQDNVNKLSEELDGWLGTSYRHYCCIKKRGVDCALFLGQVFKNLDVLKKLEYKYYSKDWHKHSNINIFMDNFKYNIKHNLKEGLEINKVECAITPMEVGDWLMFKINSKHINHSALYLGTGQIIHAVQRRGVILDNFKTWKPFMEGNYRLYYV